ncbi:MAG TPA: ABC transporter permease [Gammaproteobacteria bacterium]|nr:ABC transporter permease [Gammaproteobacteria bacterium]
MNQPGSGNDSDAHAFIVHRRDKSTKQSVLIGDKIANWSITLGGLLVIVAVITIMLFLVSVALPLATGGEVRQHSVYTLGTPKQVAWLTADEYTTLGLRITADGQVSAFHIPTGTFVTASDLEFAETATAVAGVVTREQVAFGFADGSVRFGTFNFEPGVITADNLPAGRQQLNESDSLAGITIYRELNTGDYRTITPAWTIGDAQQISEHPIIAIDYRVGGTVERPTRSFVTVDAAGVARVSRAVIQRNLMTGAEQVRLTSSTLPTLPEGTQVTRVLMASTADRVMIATRDGTLYRYDVRDFGAPVLAETTRAFDGAGDVEITSLAFLNSELAMVVGGSNGAVDVFFRLERPDANTTDGYQMVRARSHESQGSPIVAMSVSQRKKSLATLGADGSLWIRHSTSEQTLFKLQRESAADTEAAVMLMPRTDGVLLVDHNGNVDAWDFYYPHPETTLRAIFGKLWYEGYPEPTYTWQSSSGTDVFEPKYSLVPLIFGTLKATVYALMFAVPIALMGAIYTSEFLHRRVRATVKPVMEMMESLPTVVLGFIAALVLAPIIEEWIAAVILSFVSIPMGLMLGAFVWQTLPVTLSLKLGGIPKFFFMVASILLFGYVAFMLGPTFERALFYGDFKAWVNGDVGTGMPFLFLIGFPLSFMLVAWSFGRTFGHTWRNKLRDLSREQAGRIDFARWGVFVLAAALLSWAIAGLLTLAGYDPRGGVVDTYSQRNALVVGFVMGFAVIPNIYTLAEDALNSVPSHLRAASLAAGATPWQTAMWVILPVAASGVFSAVMIGMGRAVGETMIVVMAAGNTPVLDWNIFSGLRTLSANIAVELPEAVKDGTLYRTLFLAALTLFVLTFVINTLAELVRQRFRKRAFQL